MKFLKVTSSFIPSLEPPDSYRTLVLQVCGRSLEVRDYFIPSCCWVGRKLDEFMIIITKDIHIDCIWWCLWPEFIDDAPAFLRVSQAQPALFFNVAELPPHLGKFEHDYESRPCLVNNVSSWRHCHDSVGRMLEDFHVQNASSSLLFAF